MYFVADFKYFIVIFLFLPYNVPRSGELADVTERLSRGYRHVLSWNIVLLYVVVTGSPVSSSLLENNGSNLENKEGDYPGNN